MRASSKVLNPPTPSILESFHPQLASVHPVNRGPTRSF